MSGLGDYLGEVRAHLVGVYRLRLAQAPPEPTCQALADRLLDVSDEFAELWRRHDVAVPAEYPRKHFVNPLVGDVTFDVVALWTRAPPRGPASRPIGPPTRVPTTGSRDSSSSSGTATDGTAGGPPSTVSAPELPSRGVPSEARPSGRRRWPP